MNRRSALALVLGGWALGTLFMWTVATQNFATVDRILAEPPSAFQSMTANLDSGHAREILRYEASELNRLYFDRWGYAQVLLALLAVALAWKGSRRLRAGVFAAAVIAVGLQVYVVPETIRIGRIIDFQPRAPETVRQTEFWRLHNAYTGLDMLKLLTIAGCGIALLRERD
ncbi:MAG: hypothetical protein O3A53_19460 [Acidobacteria bacterium]|nr:hypothetical protein [Acidobacteriota bacterium]MDA1236960.1 hypothetical protein [Acidobacteriota bacterium]